MLVALVTPTALAVRCATTTHLQMTITPHFVDICSHLAPPMSVLLCAAHWPFIQQIKASSSSMEQLPPLLPYSCMTANGCLWTAYGLLRHQFTIWAPNLIGMMLGLYYCLTLVKLTGRMSMDDSNANNNETVSSWNLSKPNTAHHHIQALRATGLATAVLAAAGLLHIIGHAAVLLCLVWNAGCPLQACLQSMRQQPSTTSSTTMTMTLTSVSPLLASVVSRFLWTVTGMWHLHDNKVIVPNLLGLLAAMMQIWFVVQATHRVRAHQPSTSSTLAMALTP